MAGSAVAAGANLLGGIFGNEAGAGDRGEARNQAQIANGILQQIQAAPDISKPLILEKYKQAGILTPQMEQYINAGPAKAGNISEDPALKKAQMQALQQLQGRAAQGLTATDRAALNQARATTQGDTQAKIAQIQQQAQMRGQAGGGADLAAQLLAAQSGANSESQSADQVAAQAQQAALQAASQAGGLGGQIRGQEFGQNMQQAQAQDQMNRFNIQNQIAQQARNVGASNQAQAGNLANVQNIGNANVGAQNQELNNELQRQMQQYGANVNRAQIQAGGAGNLSNTLQKSGDAAAQNTQNLFGGIGQLASAGIGALGSSGGGSSYGPSAGTQAGYGINTTKSNPNAAYGDWSALNQGGQVNDYRSGGKVPGQAQVPGDHPANDTVKAMLSPGEIVLPRSLAESKIGKEILKLIHAHNSVKNKMNGSD